MSTNLSIPLPELQDALQDLHAKYFRGDEGTAVLSERVQKWQDADVALAHARAEELLRFQPSWISEDQDEYYACLQRIARHGDEEFLKSASQSLASQNPMIVGRACFVLAHAKETRAVPMLLNVLDSGNVLVMPEVIWALGMIGDVRAVQTLHKLWIKGAALDNVAQALARLGFLDSLPFLVMGLKHASTKTRLASAGAIAQIIGRHSAEDVQELWGGLIPRIEHSLDDIFVPVRVLAACILAQLGRPFSNLELRQILEMRAEPMNPLQAFFGRKR